MTPPRSVRQMTPPRSLADGLGLLLWDSRAVVVAIIGADLELVEASRTSHHHDREMAGEPATALVSAGRPGARRDGARGCRAGSVGPRPGAGSRGKRSAPGLPDPTCRRRRLDPPRRRTVRHGHVHGGRAAPGGHAGPHQRAATDDSGSRSSRPPHDHGPAHQAREPAAPGGRSGTRIATASAAEPVSASARTSTISRRSTTSAATPPETRCCASSAICSVRRAGRTTWWRATAARSSWPSSHEPTSTGRRAGRNARGPRWPRVAPRSWADQ